MFHRPIARRLVVPAALVVLLGALTAVTPVRAATSLVVNSNADSAANPADCNGSNTCTLRDAIAITDVAGGTNAITFASTVTSPIVLSQGVLTVSGQTLNLTGSGAAVTVIDANHASQVILVAAGGTLNLAGVTLQNGVGDTGGGLENLGTASVTDSVVTTNAAVAFASITCDGPCPGLGGGIYSTGSLTLLRTTVSNNSDPSGDGGGIFAAGGPLTLTSSTVSGDTADFGAGIFTVNGVGATVSASTFTADVASSWAGGIFSSGTTTVVNSTFSGNSSGGGGVFGWGAGILENSGALSLINSTIANNSAASTGGGLAVAFGATTAAVANTIIANNSPVNCGTNSSSPFVVSGGGNLEDANTCQFTAASDQHNVASGLQTALTDNGGPTKTLAPLPGSAAREHGGDAVCSLAQPAGTGGVDQRGVPRPQAVHCDAGAVEVDQPTLPITFSPATPDFTQPVVVTVTVLPSTPLAGTPQGSVTLMQGAATVGTSALDGTGAAAFNLGAQPIGSSDFTASYTATNGFFSETTSGATTLTVGKAPVTGTVSASPGSITEGQTETFTAVFTPPTGTAPKPVGTASFFDGSTLLGSATVDPGTAVFATNQLGPGTHLISVNYSGDPNYQAAAAVASVTVTVQALAVPAAGFSPSQQPLAPGLALLLGGLGLVLRARRGR